MTSEYLTLKGHMQFEPLGGETFTVDELKKLKIDPFRGLMDEILYNCEEEDFLEWSNIDEYYAEHPEENNMDVDIGEFIVKFLLKLGSKMDIRTIKFEEYDDGYDYTVTLNYKFVDLMAKCIEEGE